MWPAKPRDSESFPQSEPEIPGTIAFPAASSYYLIGRSSVVLTAPDWPPDPSHSSGRLGGVFRIPGRGSLAQSVIRRPALPRLPCRPLFNS